MAYKQQMIWRVVLMSLMSIIPLQAMEQLTDEFANLSCNEKKEKKRIEREKREARGLQELAQVRNFSSDERLHIDALRLMQHKFHAPNDVIAQIAPYLIADASSQRSCLALLCHLLFCKFSPETLLKAFEQYYRKEYRLYNNTVICNSVKFANEHTYNTVIPFLKCFDYPTREIIDTAVNRNLTAGNDISPWDQLLRACENCKPKNALWNVALLNACTKLSSNFPISTRNFIKRLITSNQADINAQDKQTKSTPLMIAAGHHDPDFIQWLLDHGADKTMQNQDGDTALLQALVHNNGHLIPLLTDPAVINQKNNDGVYPLLATVPMSWNLVSCLSAMHTLLTAGATVDFDLLFSITQERKDPRPFLSFLIDDGTCAYNYENDTIDKINPVTINLEDAEGDTLLIKIAPGQQWSLLTHLLSFPDLRIDHQNKRGQTALMCAEYHINGNNLLLKGANPNIQDNLGNTVLHLIAYNYLSYAQPGLVHYAQTNACHNAIRGFARVLAEHGADFTIKNHEGKTALDVAKDIQDKDHKLYEDYKWLIEQQQYTHALEQQQIAEQQREHHVL